MLVEEDGDVVGPDGGEDAGSVGDFFLAFVDGLGRIDLKGGG